MSAASLMMLPPALLFSQRHDKLSTPSVHTRSLTHLA